MTVTTRNRTSAGQALAHALLAYANEPDVLVLAVSHGAVPVAAEIARELRAPLDILFMQQIAAPMHNEVALGTVVTGGVRLVNRAVAGALGVRDDEVACLAAREEAELDRRLAACRGARPLPRVAARCVIAVDEAVRTGATLQSAIAALREHGARRIVAAVAVGEREGLTHVQRDADELLCLETPVPFGSTEQPYADLPPISDDDVKNVLAARWAEEARHAIPRGAGLRVVGDTGETDPAPRLWCTSSVRLHSGRRLLEGTLTRPEPVHGLIVAAEGIAGSPSAGLVDALNESFAAHGFATLHFSLLAGEEARAEPMVDGERHDTRVLAERIGWLIEWIAGEPELCALPLCLFGADTAAAAALKAAARRPERIAAVVAMSAAAAPARPDLPQVRAPCLYIVGGLDPHALAASAEAAVHMHAEHRIEVIAGSGALFEDAGKLGQAALHACRWFERHTAAAAGGAPAAPHRSP